MSHSDAWDSFPARSEPPVQDTLSSGTSQLNRYSTIVAPRAAQQSQIAPRNASEPSTEPIPPASSDAPLHIGEAQMAEPETAPRRNIDDCIKDLVESSGKSIHSFARIDIPDGDTWAFISPPPQEPEQDNAVYQEIKDRYSRPFRVSSALLKASESALLLKQLGSPTQQFRLIRQQGLNPHHLAMKNIKYIVNLTPAVEDDEAVELISELCCPASMVQWVRTSQQWRVSANLVGGQDELFPVAKGPLEDRPLVPDYTPLRHRLCIERVLALIHGLDPCLNSAPKIWTTVMTATKQLKIPAHKLSEMSLDNYVVSWVRATPNNFIIELHPEAILKLADELQIAHLCQDAFAILVGEAALESVSRQNQDLPHTFNKTTHGRPQGSNHEFWKTRIQYSRDVLEKRIMEQFRLLLDPAMQWVESLPGVQKLKEKLETESPAEFKNWLSMLKNYILGAIYHCICPRYTEADEPLQSFRTHGDFNRAALRDVFNLLDYKERPLTRTFWKILDQMELGKFDDKPWFSNLHTEPNNMKFTMDIGQKSIDKQDQLETAGIVKKINSKKLDDFTTRMQMMHAWRNHQPEYDTDSESETPRKKVRFSGSSVDNDDDAAWATSANSLALRYQANKSESSNNVLGKSTSIDKPGPTQDEAVTFRFKSSRTDGKWLPETPFATAQMSPQHAVSSTSNDQVINTDDSIEAQSRKHHGLSAPEADPQGFWQWAKKQTASVIGTHDVVGAQDEKFNDEMKSLTEDDDSIFTPRIRNELFSKIDLDGANPPQNTPNRPPRVLQEVFQPESPTLLQVPRRRPASLATVSERAGADDNASTSGLYRSNAPGYTTWSEYDLVTLTKILEEADTHLHFIASEYLRKQSYDQDGDSIACDTIDTLLCLEECETKALPLWAGGLDDGSGGVFNEDVPILPSDDLGFGPGRFGLKHHGSDSEYSGLSNFSVTDSTANTSRLVNNGDVASVIQDRRRVYAASEVESVVHAPVSDAGTESTWDRVSKIGTPQDSLLGDNDGVLPPESIEAPDFSDAGSAIFSPSAAVSVIGDNENARNMAFSAAMDVSPDEAEEFADLFRDDSDDDGFDEANMMVSDDDEDDEQMDADYDVVDDDDGGDGEQYAPEPSTPNKHTAVSAQGKNKSSVDGDANVLIKYKERSPTPLGFTSEAD